MDEGIVWKILYKSIGNNKIVEYFNNIPIENKNDSKKNFLPSVYLKLKMQNKNSNQIAISGISSIKFCPITKAGEIQSIRVKNIGSFLSNNLEIE